jgi:hypothetical protein
MPPVRTQNSNLHILLQKELIGHRVCRVVDISLFFFFFFFYFFFVTNFIQQKNSIYFKKDHTVEIQLVIYKNSDKQGSKLIEVPQPLANKLRAFVAYIRPLIGTVQFEWRV